MSHVEQRPVSSTPSRRKRRLLWNCAGLLIALIAITYIPELTLWLPKYMGLSK